MRSVLHHNSTKPIALGITIALSIITIVIAGCEIDPDTFDAHADAFYLSNGNAILFITSDQAPHQRFNIHLVDQPYPFDSKTDDAFINQQRMVKTTRSTNLENFTLHCGATEEHPDLRTTLVFWSEDNWQGQKQKFECGGLGPNDQELTSTITAASSFCIVNNLAHADRRDRCETGPRCDDNMKNGQESGVDCGGLCSLNCLFGSPCTADSDCEDRACNGGFCAAPPPKAAGLLTLRLKLKPNPPSNTFSGGVDWGGSGGYITSDGRGIFNDLETYQLAGTLRSDGKYRVTVVHQVKDLRSGPWFITYVATDFETTFNGGCPVVLEEGKRLAINFEEGKSTCTTQTVFP
jgi:hypothetical protein